MVEEGVVCQVGKGEVQTQFSQFRVLLDLAVADPIDLDTAVRPVQSFSP